jgi:hypothetical protein
MTKFVSRRGTLGIAPEATRGTPVSPVYWLPWAKMAFFDGVEKAAENQGLGQIADQDSEYVVSKFGQGTVDAEIYDNGLGYILESLLGAAPVDSGGNPYTHTYTLSQSNQAKSLSLYWKDPDRSYMFALATVDMLKITMKPGGMIEYSVGFKSKVARDWASQTPIFTSLGSKFLHQDLSFKLATTIGGLGAATAISLKSLEITIARNTMFDNVLGTVEPEDILSQSLSVEGNLDLNLTDDTYRNLMLNGTYNAMEIKLTRVLNTSSLQFQFPRVSFNTWQPDYSLDNIASQKINFKGNYDATNAQDIISTCVLINSKASY